MKKFGVTPEGRDLRGQYMPWEFVQIHEQYGFQGSLGLSAIRAPKKAYGNR
jgi:hypothetical protein